ncbi:MAG: PilN domain-containing protein [Sulfuritalea sp.]|nr:PilN domain-containing protein [Sulfuritalea sp.]
MSAQINLYHPRFLKERDLLTLGNVVLSASVLYLLLAIAGGWAWRDANERRARASVAETQLKTIKDQIVVATQAAKTRTPSPRLIAELERAEEQLRRRTEIARLLESGEIGSTGGFAEFFRGLARQVPQGLWLTGFTFGSGGADMEIRGRMLEAAALPEYIRRLGEEKAFQGRSFAALTMDRSTSAPAVRPAEAGAAVSPAPTFSAKAIDFVLMPKMVEAKEPAR